MKKRLFCWGATLFLLPLTTFAQSDTLINIPQLSGGGFNGYINAVYAMFISIAALLAVVKIIVAGVKYMFSDVVTQKSDAKKDIQGALLGLLVVLAAVLILTVINPDLTNFNVNGVANNQIAAQTPTGVTGNNDPAFCASSGCTAVGCGSVVNCSTWCAGVGGTYQRTNPNAASYRCVVPQTATPPSTFTCPLRGRAGTPDCGVSAAICSQLGGTAGTYRVTDTQITCS